MNEVSKIGHNNPPTPFDEAAAAIESLSVEATNWLDGEPISTQGQADTVAALIDQARTAKKEADSARKAEAKPFDDGKKEVQARYKPLIEKADTIADGCKRLLAPFLEKIEAEKRAKAEEEARKAEAARQAAAEAARNADMTNLAERQEADAKALEARQADMAAKAAAKDKASGSSGARAITLRSVFSGEITNLTKAARHYWKTDADTIRKTIEGLVARDVRNGVREIPGVEVIEEKVAQ